MGKIYDWSTTDADNDDADSDIKAKGDVNSIRNADDNDRAIMGANARFLADNNGTRDASTADTMTYTSAQGFTSYVDGMTFLIGGVTNTGAATLNVDTLGAKDVKKYQGAAIEALEANDIITGQPMLLVYDGTQFVLLNPGTSNGIANVVEDTSPQLGGDLDVNGNGVTSPDGTDKITIPNGSINLQTNSTSRADITDSGIRLGGANARVTTILDEDAMGSDSATALATQQSIKAYVDNNSGSSTTYGAVGTYVFAAENANDVSERTGGDTLAGSNLNPASITNTGPTFNSSTTLSGTWQLMGNYFSTASVNDKPTSLWLRIS